MTFRIVRLDDRYKGRGSFEFFVEASKLSQFLEWRDWAIESWGNGIERDFASVRPGILWGWLSDDGHHLRIYFKSEQEVNWFVLRWS